MCMCDVSVIVPAYNAEQYIDQCIQSLLKQTKKRLEIIIVNDGSTDGTYDIIQNYQRENENIRIISQENGGLESARIAGFKQANGKYIGWVDADDFVDAQMFEILYDVAEKNKAEIVFCDYNFFPTSTTAKVKWYTPFEGKKNWKYLDKNTQFWNKIFSRDLLERVNLIELLEKFGEYAPILPMMEAKNVISINQKLYYYRVGHDSMSGGSFVGKVAHYWIGVHISAHLRDMIFGKTYQKELEIYFDYRYIYTLIMLAIVSAKNSDPESYKYAKAELRNQRYLKNPYLNLIISKNYGFIKCFAMTRIIPSNYTIARIITKAVL